MQLQGGGGGGYSAPRVGATAGASGGSRKRSKARINTGASYAGAASGARSSGGGGGGRRGTGVSTRGREGESATYMGGVGSNAMGNISAAKPPKPPKLSDFLAGDSAYTSQKSALDKAKADYLAQQNLAKTQYMTGYAGDLDTLKTNRTSSLADLENDYASRGMMNSGLYADSLATTTNDWDKRNSQLEQAKAAFLSGLTSDYTNFSQEQLIALQKAEQEAAARRAAQYGA